MGSLRLSVQSRWQTQGPTSFLCHVHPCAMGNFMDLASTLPHPSLSSFVTLLLLLAVTIFFLLSTRHLTSNRGSPRPKFSSRNDQTKLRELLDLMEGYNKFRQD